MVRLHSQEDSINSLRKSVIEQATLFLNDAGEFYPFGTALDFNNKLVPIGIYTGEEHPDSNFVLKELGKAIWDGLQKGLYKLAAMAIDIYLPIEQGEKIPALEIRIVNPEGQLVIKYRVPYVINNNKKVEFSELITVNE
jgi:hypothetical protein